MKKFFITILLLAGIVLKSEAQDYSTISKEYCLCFEKLKDTMKAEYRELIIKATSEVDIKTAFVREAGKLSDEKRKELSIQLSKIGVMMDSDDNEAGKCGIKLDEIYAEYNDTPEKEKVFGDKMIVALKDFPDCAFFNAILKLALAFSEEGE
jgi:hypothetical protein